MIYILLDILTTIPQAVILGLCPCSCLRIRRRRLFLLLTTLLSAGVHLSFVYFLSDLNFLRSIASMATLFVLNQIFSQERRGKTALFTVLLIGILAATELFSFWVYSLLLRGNPYIEMSATTPAWLVYKSLALFCLCIFASIYTLIWNKLLRRHLNTPVAFFLFPLSQVFLIAMITDWVLADPGNAFAVHYEIIATCICIVADIFLFFTIKQYGERQALESQKKLAEAQLRIQLDHYNNLVSTIEQVSHLRHDMNNQLQTIHSLLRRGENALAQEQAAMLQEHWNQASTKTFCDNKIVDAVLLEKQRLCSDEEITFLPRVAVPAFVPIDGVELCSLFSNILDNAINACKGVPAEHRKISLSAGISANIFTIEASNPAVSAPARRTGKNPPLLPEHGLGLDILGQIADKHGGSVRCTFEHGQFCIRVQLNLAQ